MKIIKQGVVIRYDCNKCGCAFLAAKCEVVLDTEPKQSGMPNLYIAECPCCGQKLKEKWEHEKAD